jgi:hypothetical protein
MGIHSLPARRWGQIGLVALLGLALALATVSAGRADASVWHKDGATVAKKKCKKKKKGKKSAAVAKKKKCKKKKAPVVAPPAPQPKGPITRVEITWPGTADLDAHAWSNGLHDGWNETVPTPTGFGDYEVQIPGTTYESSETLANRERIVETSPNPSVGMTFGICNYANVSNAEDTDVTATTTFANGETVTDTFEIRVGENFTTEELRPEGGPVDPTDDWCPEVH